MAKPAVSVVAANSDNATNEDISPVSRELVIGLVGYAGAGCSTAARRLRILLEKEDYEVHVIKMSDLIIEALPDESVPAVEEGIKEGATKFARAQALQGLGDRLREDRKDFAVAALATRKIIEMRDGRKAGAEKIAYILDSVKHKSEVDLLREVYDRSFRLIAVHCERPKRESRLIGDETSSAKYRGVDRNEVIKLIDRDEKDPDNDHGQQVRDAFYLGDFFIDNNFGSVDGAELNDDLNRFISLMLGAGIVRPTQAERAMYNAHAAALQSSCLSRQVGAALINSDGTLIATGTNEVPAFNGGVYEDGGNPDHRCHVWDWEWPDGEQTLTFKGCHNQRKKKKLASNIGDWLAENLAGAMAKLAHPEPRDGGADTAGAARRKAETSIREFLESESQMFLKIPGIKDIVEYSRSIHAEMNALFNAARSGASTVGAKLFCTTYPCHNCARHMVTAGVSEVQYIEPYVKSLATELHYDSIASERPAEGVKASQMVVAPFTGVGPRMYEDFFTKRDELKDKSGNLTAPVADTPRTAVRVLQLEEVEQKAAGLVD